MTNDQAVAWLAEMSKAYMVHTMHGNGTVSILVVPAGNFGDPICKGQNCQLASAVEDAKRAYDQYLRFRAE